MIKREKIEKHILKAMENIDEAVHLTWALKDNDMTIEELHDSIDAFMQASALLKRPLQQHFDRLARARLILESKTRRK